MDGFTQFLASETGRIVCFAFLAMGLLDIFITRLPFMPLAKARMAIEAKIQPGMSPDAKQPFEQQLKSHKVLQVATTVAGVAFIALAIFGLTR